MLLEIAVFNISSAIQAANAGANRLELCENPLEGGTTPSYGTLKTVRERINIPVFPIIRPRGGDFFYNEEEFEVLKKDVALCKELGFTGLVTGILKKDGTVDIERTKELVEIAAPLELTFHRAFDRTKDPFQALEDVITTGCKRILTSGQVPNVGNATSLIKQLIEKADGRIIILQGSGVRSSNLQQLINETGGVEYHSSARKNKNSDMEFTVASMQESLTETVVDEEEVIKMKKILS